MSIPDPIVLLDARARYVHPAFQMSRASTKTVFDAAGQLVTVPPNALGWDHDPATGRSLGYLCEKEGINRIWHSNDLTQNDWGKVGSSITPAAITGPGGRAFGKVVENTDTTGHGVRQLHSALSGGPFCLYAVCKAGERDAVQLRAASTTDTSIWITSNFDLTDGTILSGGASGGATLIKNGSVSLIDGFFLCWMSGSLGEEPEDAVTQIWMRGPSNDLTYEGDGISGVYLGMAQLEEGADGPTSYIETTSSSAARPRDNLRCTALNSMPWWSWDRGTVVIAVALPDYNYAGFLMGLAARMVIQRNAQGKLFLAGIRLDSTEDLLGAEEAPGRHIIAMGWEGLQAVACADGKPPVKTALTEPFPSNTNLGLGINGVSDNPAHCSLLRAAYYPARVSDADLQSLTAIQE